MKHTALLFTCLLTALLGASAAGFLSHSLYEKGSYFYILTPALVSLLPGLLIACFLGSKPPYSKRSLTICVLITSLLFFLARFYVSLLYIIGWEQWVHGFTELPSYTWFRMTEGEVVVVPTAEQIEGTSFLTSLFNIADLAVYLFTFRYFYRASAGCDKTQLESNR